MPDEPLVTQVPSDHVAAFRDLTARWLDNPTLVLTEPAQHPPPPTTPWGTPPTDADHAAATLAIAQLGTTARTQREFLLTLLDTPTSPVDDATLATRCGVTPQAVTQVAASLSETFAATDRPPPFQTTTVDKGTHYWIPKPLVTVIPLAFPQRPAV